MTKMISFNCVSVASDLLKELSNLSCLELWFRNHTPMWNKATTPRPFEVGEVIWSVQSLQSQTNSEAVCLGLP